MHPPYLHLLLAVPPVAAGFAVLSLAAVSKRLLLTQIVAVCLACAIALVGARLSSLARNRLSPAIAAMIFTLICLAVPLLENASGPERWVLLGPVRLYMAPVVLPAFLVAVSVLIHRCDHFRWLALGATVSASALLSIQPDASQVLAVLVAVAVAFVRARSNRLVAGVTLALISLIAVWAFSRPDPLEPVPYVESVFRLALERSIFAGAAIIACAFALLTGLYICSLRGAAWLSVTAGYYAVLFVCSVAGLTPAPLIGYGAGPVLGFGLMVAMSSWVFEEEPPNSFKPTPNSGAA